MIVLLRFNKIVLGGFIFSYKIEHPANSRYTITVFDIYPPQVYSPTLRRKVIFTRYHHFLGDRVK